MMDTYGNKDLAKKVARIEFIKRGAILLSCLLGLFNALLVIYLLYRVDNNTSAIRTTQVEGTPTGKKISKLADTIEDCVSPTGKCYKEGQARTKGVLDNVGVIIILSNSCADEMGTQDYSTIRACVYSKLDKELKNVEK